MLVSLDGYILIPRIDGKYNVFQHSIDNIINQDTVIINATKHGGELLCMECI